MELSAAGADDDPAWFEKQMAHFSQVPTNVDALLANQREEQAAVWARFESRFPGKAPAIRHRLEKVAAAAKNREAVRSEVTRLARLLRFFLLKAGAVTGIGEEVFFLSLDEMAEVLAGDKVSLSRLPARQDVYQRYCALPPYPAIIIGRFDPFTWAADPNRRSDIYDARQTGSASLSSTIKGFAGSAGCVEGIVRRIDCMEDCEPDPTGRDSCHHHHQHWLDADFPAPCRHRHRCGRAALTCSHRGARAGHPGGGWLRQCHHAAQNGRPRPRGWRARHC